MIKALILAGGKGTRLLPMTLNTPKPIVPIANIPFVFYQLDLLKRARITEVILSLSYLPRSIRDLLGEGNRYGLMVRYTVEDSPLGTAGAFKKAQNLLDDTTVVFNGDVLTDLDISKVIAFHKQQQADATIVLAPVENPSAYGLVECTSDHQVARFVEKPAPEEITCNTINAGVYVLEPQILDFIPPNQNYSLEREVFPRILESGKKFCAYLLNGYFLDIGTPQKYLEANFSVLSGRLPLPDFPQLYRAKEYKMESGVSIDQQSLLDENCHVRSGVRIRNSVIGPNCRIGKNVLIENAVVWGATRLEADAVISGCIIGKGCYIGAFSRIGRGHAIADKSTIGEYSYLDTP